jgi:hypothetical protein
MASCKYHPDRPGVGVCMRCRVVICQACCTRVDGVNHCHACLKALGRRPETSSAGWLPAVLLALLTLGGSWLLLLAGGWLLQGRLAP